MKKKFFSDFIIFICLFILSGFISLFLGMERWVDTKNYHIYNPWAFLNNRIGVDFIPAGVQSYFNPILDIPYYLAIKYFNNHPQIITFLYGFSYALFLFLIYKIADIVFKNCHKVVFTSISVLVAGLSGLVINNIGALNHDIFISDLVLISVYILLKLFDEKKYSIKLLLIAGCMLGTATGLKYTAFVFVVSIFITFLIFHKHFEKAFKSFGWLILGMFAGFLIVDGFWMYKLYQTFQNPFFPYFNWFFHSNYINQDNVFISTIKHHMPEEFWKYWLYPFPRGNFETNLITFFCICVINLFTMPFIKKEKNREVFNKVDFLVCFSIIGYLIWLRIFGVERYLVLLFGFLGILGIALIMKLSNKLGIMFILLIVTFISTVFYFNYTYKRTVNTRIPAYGYILDVEDLNIPDNSIVFTGTGVGIILPSQNKNVIYIKSTGFMPAQKIDDVKKKIKTSSDKVFLINDLNLQKYPIRESEKLQKHNSDMNDRMYYRIKKSMKNVKSLSNFDVDLDKMTCSIINGNYYKQDSEAFYFCKLNILK